MARGREDPRGLCEHLRGHWPLRPGVGEGGPRQGRLCFQQLALLAQEEREDDCKEEGCKEVDCKAESCNEKDCKEEDCNSNPEASFL